MASKKSTAVLLPNLGLYFDRAILDLNPRMLADGLNFRVKEGKLTNLNLGWTRFGTFTLNGPLRMITDFFIASGSELLVFVTDTDIYRYINASSVLYLTPRYETGTASRSGNTVTGVGTSWTANAKIGDEIFFGSTGQNDPAASWHLITNVGGNTTLTTLDSGTVGSGAYTIRRKFTGNKTNVWNNAIFANASPSNANELWMTNGLDNIVRWNGSDTQVEVMSALNFTAKVITVYQNMMLFFNLVQGGLHKPTDMINSNPGEPQNVTSGLSEQFKVHTFTEEVVAASPIGDNLAIYSYTSRGIVTLAQFVGDPLVFTFRQASFGQAPISIGAIANYGPFHEFVARDSEYFFDGATVKPVNRHVWRDILRQQDPTRNFLAYSIFDYENADLIWVIPLTSDPKGGTTGQPNVAWGEHYLEDPGSSQIGQPHSKRSFPFTAVGYFKQQTGLLWSDLTNSWSSYNFRWNDKFFSSAFPLILAGDDSGKIYTINTSQDANGAALGSFVRFGRRAVADGRVRGLLTRVYPFVSSLTNPLQVSVLMADSADGASMITDTQDFDQTQPEGGHFTTHYRRGRFFQVHFSTNGPGQPWEISGYDYDVRSGGKR
jgi:hypothetical protein